MTFLPFHQLASVKSTVANHLRVALITALRQALAIGGAYVRLRVVQWRDFNRHYLTAQPVAVFVALPVISCHFLAERAKTYKTAA